VKVQDLNINPTANKPNGQPVNEQGLAPERPSSASSTGDGGANMTPPANLANGQPVEQSPTPEGPSSVPSIGGDLFDLTKLKLSQDFAADLGVKKILLTVPVRRPDKQAFIRVHPDAAYSLETAVLVSDEDRETYLVERSLWSELRDVVPKVLFTAITKQGIVFLWPVRLPGTDGRHDEWNRSALEAATVATKAWIRVVSNTSLGAYEVLQATGNYPEPEWPDIPFQELVRIAFKDRFILSMDHPAIRRLRGEI
jgi:hypothetical protein